MKLLIITVLVLATATLTAQTKTEKKVATAVEQLRQAMIDADSAKLNKLVSPILSYGHSSGAVDDKRIFIEKLTTGKSDFVTISLTEQTISVEKNTAIVRHRLDATSNDGGKPGEVHLKVLLIWKKYGKNWKLIARQAVKIT